MTPVSACTVTGAGTAGNYGARRQGIIVTAVPATLRGLRITRFGRLRLPALLFVIDDRFRRFRNHICHASTGHKAKPAGAVRAGGDYGLGRRTVGGQFAAKAATRASNIHKKTPRLADKNRHIIPRHSSRSPLCWQVPLQAQCINVRKIGPWSGFAAQKH